MELEGSDGQIGWEPPARPLGGGDRHATHGHTSSVARSNGSGIVGRPAIPSAAPSSQPQRVADPSAATEAQLLRGIAESDRRAFDVLYRAYYPRLHRFIDQMLGCSSLTEEVLNDTMLVVWRKAHTFDATSKVSTWIFAIAYRKALKARAREGQAGRHMHSMTDVQACEGLWEATEDGPESKAMSGESRARIARALAELSPEHRAVVTMTYYHGYAYREIATIVGCPVDTVKTRMFHARRKLRLLLGAEHEDRI